jgi:hypothetical protein
VIVADTILFICFTIHSSFAKGHDISSSSGILIQSQAASIASSESATAICRHVALGSLWKRILKGGCFASNLGQIRLVLGSLHISMIPLQVCYCTENVFK